MTCPCGKPTGENGRYLCEDCTNQLVYDVARVPGTVAELQVEVTKQAVKAPGVGGGGGDNIGFDLYASELSGLLLHQLSQLERLVGGAAAGTIKGRALYLVKNVHHALLKPDVTGWALDLHDTLTRALHKIDQQPERADFGECECGNRLIAPRDAENAKCRHCGNVYSVAELREWRTDRTFDALAGAYLTVTDLCAALEVMGLDTPQPTVSMWIARGKLTADPAEAASRGGRPGKRWSVEDAVECAEKRRRVTRRTRV